MWIGQLTSLEKLQLHNNRLTIMPDTTRELRAAGRNLYMVDAAPAHATTGVACLVPAPPETLHHARR